MSINAKRYLEKVRGKLTLGSAIRSIRLCEEESQTAFAKKLKISTQYLCDLEHNRKIISPKKAKKFAENNNISLSRLTEFLLSKVTSSSYSSLDELPVSDWVNMVSEGEVEYVRTPTSRKTLKKEFYQAKNRK